LRPSKHVSVYSMGVWELFKEEFPMVQEHHILDPQFESGTAIQAGPRIQVGDRLVGSRLWFLSEYANHLIQFQQDRFITNWRRQPNYPIRALRDWWKRLKET